MKKVLFSVLALLVCLTAILSFTSCNNGKEGDDTSDLTSSADETTAPVTTKAIDTTDSTVETTDDEITTQITTAEDKETTVVTTEEITTDALTTPEVTTAEDTAGETTTADDIKTDPRTDLIEVCRSYDGKTASYNAYYEFSEELFTNQYGSYTNLQDAIDDIEGTGGTIMISDITEGSPDVGVCLNVVIPDDGCFYRIAYNYRNVDLTFNYGVTYDDDCVPHGYAYYSDIYQLDGIAGLDNTHIFVWTSSEGLEPGYYLMTDDADPESIFNYRYEKLGDIKDYWPGLPDGEKLPE